MIIHEKKLILGFAVICLLYFIYSLCFSIYDMETAKRIIWRNATNISYSHAGYRVSTIISSYQKGNMIIARRYSSSSEGITIWSYETEQQGNNVNISFFVKNKDYEQLASRSENKNANKAKSIPFFGLRKVNQYPNKFLLFLELFKYNFSTYIVMLIMCLPFVIVYLMKNIIKSNKIEIIEIKRDLDFYLKIGNLYLLMLLWNFFI